MKSKPSIRKIITTKAKGAGNLPINKQDTRPDTLLENLTTLNLSPEIKDEIKRRSKRGEPRTRISREMGIAKIYVNRVLEIA